MGDNLDVGATAEVEEISTESKSMEETLRETLDSINAKGEDTADASAEKPEPEVKSEKIRDEKGKFAKATPVEAAKDNTVADNAAMAEPVTLEKTDIPEVQPLPNSWKKEAAEAWAKADPILRAEVARREADIHKGIEQYRQAAEYAHSLDQAISPYKQTLANLNISPQVAIKELMAADHKLRYGNQQDKEMYFAQLAQHYGIDLGSTAQTVQSIDPRVYELAQRNQYLEQNLQQQQQAVQQQAEQALNSEIAQFAADPKNAHFETVKLHMAALLQAGQAKDLSDAYEQAIYANPVTRSAVLQQQAQAAKEEAARKAQAARAASGVNIRSTPAMPTRPGTGSLEDTAREIYRKMYPI